MKFKFALAAVCAMVASQAYCVQDVTRQFDITALNGAGSPVTASDIEMFAVDPSSGKMVYSNATDTNDTDGFAIVRTGPGATAPLTVVTGASAILAAVDAANGATAAPALLSLRGMGIDTAGNIILAFDPSSSTDAWLVRLTGGMNGAPTVEVIGGAATPNLVDGTNAMTVVGTTAYLCRNGAFAGAGNSPADGIITFSTTGTANASQAGTVLVSEATLTAAGGLNQTAADIVINAIAPTSGGNLVATNSGAATSNDDIIQITAAGAVSTVRTGPQARTDLGYTDTGYAAITANTSNGDIYIWLNDFNAGGTSATDGNAFVKITGGSGAMTKVINEAEIQADTDYNAAGFFTNVQGVVYYSNALYWTDDNLEAIYKVVTSASGVSDWSVY
jgi:hypothetical protein